MGFKKYHQLLVYSKYQSSILYVYVDTAEIKLYYGS